MSTASPPVQNPLQSYIEPFRFRWIQGPGADLAMQLCWIPFALAAWLLADHPEGLRSLMYATFLFSFTHQPLSLCLVYGDPARFRLRRQLFLWSPPILLGAVVVALQIHPIVLAVIAGLWNAEHTLMQRYGMTRIYGRMCGQQRGGIELVMLFAWLLLAVLWAAADSSTPERVVALGIQGTNQLAFDLLMNLQPYTAILKPIALVVTAIISVRWFLEEYGRPSRNAAKWLYLLSTAALFVVMLINPIAGYIGYVGSHACEYFFIVRRSLAAYQTPATGGWLGRSVRGLGVRFGFMAAYLAILVFLVFVLENAASPYWYSLVFFTVGALHFWYDGFIWKLRQTPVAASVGATQ